MNEYRGEVALELSGTTHTLRYTWAAVLELRREFGNDFDQHITTAIVALDLETVAKALAIGLQGSWPGCKPADVIAASPPIAEGINAIQLALRLAFHGPGEVRTQDKPRPWRAALGRVKQILSRYLLPPQSQAA